MLHRSQAAALVLSQVHANESYIDLNFVERFDQLLYGRGTCHHLKPSSPIQNSANQLTKHGIGVGDQDANSARFFLRVHRSLTPA